MLAQHEEEETLPDPVADPFPVENHEDEEEIPVEEEPEGPEVDGDWNEHDRAPVFSGTSVESCIFWEKFWVEWKRHRSQHEMQQCSVLISFVLMCVFSIMLF